VWWMGVTLYKKELEKEITLFYIYKIMINRWKCIKNYSVLQF
jgi:hypothetical protein